MSEKSQEHKKDPWFWVCVNAAAETDELFENFLRLSGHKLSTSGLSLMIDQATGYQKKVFEEFLDFVKFSVYDRLPNPIDQAIQASLSDTKREGEK